MYDYCQSHFLPSLGTFGLPPDLLIHKNNEVALPDLVITKRVENNVVVGCLIRLREKHTDGVKQSFQWKRLAEALWMKPLEVEVYIDSAPLIEQLESGQSRREPRMDGLLAYACQELRALKAKVLWVQTDRQRADRHTKYKMERDRGSQAPKFVQKQMKGDRKILDFVKACRGKRKSDSRGSSRVRG
uniref:Uncharacterized protein n=1 Tax=Chromera velia CCMP2878 TaxID=1169474 RepID=A0A0G4GJA5_9ALVE|eukprot:Cvel_4790.t1-p1 / transcript=Cvel_4790.t1 / gene=Cvel_4790 / organism=Chromera_velia_CCMP2878 / gene_product=hypothetical protein / transcript_product=hypothetical protein / location=Cvel_scaffold214:28455-37366(+) / protein_length=186 / sequence_SO=supercontig / SO=protein_coding / is_pseudo=false